MAVEDEHQWLKTTNKMLFSSTICTSASCFFSSNFHSRFLLFSLPLSSKKSNVKIEKNWKTDVTSHCEISCQKVVVTISFFFQKCYYGMMFGLRLGPLQLLFQARAIFKCRCCQLPLCTTICTLSITIMYLIQEQ